QMLGLQARLRALSPHMDHLEGLSGHHRQGERSAEKLATSLAFGSVDQHPVTLGHRLSHASCRCVLRPRESSALKASIAAGAFSLPFPLLSRYCMRAVGRCRRTAYNLPPNVQQRGGSMTLAEFRAQRDRHATAEAKRAWVQEVSDPESLPEGMMRFTVYECDEPGLGVIIDRYLDLELIYDQRADTLYDAEDIAVHR